MAAIVYHSGLQTHLESPQLVESRTLRLKLPSPQSIDLPFKSCFRDSNLKTNHHEENISKTETFQKPNTNTWNFLDSLSNNISQNTSKKETTYVHPQQKRSSLVLSPKSLELCTENLGNESGTDIIENSIENMLLFSSFEQRQPCRQVLVAKKAKTMNFPPPLTTIRGSESLRVKPHREDGRLVIEVTKVPPSTSCFQADRSHGRLRLCFSTNFDQEEEEEDEDENNDDVADENEQPLNEEFLEEFCENEIIEGKIQESEKRDKETEDKTEDETEEQEIESVVIACGCECEEKKGNDVRMEKYERLRRCKESDENENNELLNWCETLWVATT
ncbi:protein FANTASTIC FOUR 3 [Cicer arietinum]|uniref:Protein FANTASTIC FOUR 3 n=1 Tax=Cicer arietinum TaxID=3827 RepID=A0A1S2XZ08_CICAR|nr:protein FANTASTIC FOUR 3 [Cicer arietinum]